MDKQAGNVSQKAPAELEVKVAQQAAELACTNAILREEIAKRKQLEQQVIQSERLATLGRMATALAHELSNPLQIIHGYLDLIIDFPLEPDEKERYLHVISCEIEHIIDVSQNMLDYARSQYVQLQPVALGELVERVVALTNIELQRRGIQVTVDIQDVPLVMAVPEQLIQVFLNLVINAIESARSRLTIALRCNKEGIIITFDDDGPVIPPTVLPNIFEPFYTTKSDGNGLGLWISHSVIQKHKGTLSVENLSSERGVRFTVTLPTASLPELEV